MPTSSTPPEPLMFAPCRRPRPLRQFGAREGQHLIETFAPVSGKACTPKIAASLPTAEQIMQIWFSPEHAKATPEPCQGSEPHANFCKVKANASGALPSKHF